MERPRVVEPWPTVEQAIRVWIICAPNHVQRAVGKGARGAATDEERTMVARHLVEKMRVSQWEVTRLEVRPVRDVSSHNPGKDRG